MAIVELQQVVATENPGRLDQVVRDLTGRSRSEIRGMFHQQCVQLNGEVCREPGATMKLGDVIVVRHDPHTRYHEPPPERVNSAFRVVFEDEFLIVVDKAASILTVPTDHGETNTLLGALNVYLARRRGRAAVVHRLDRGTSGLLVFAKNARIANELIEQFRVRKAEREYAAIVAGTLRNSTGTFTTHMATTKSLQRYSTDDDEEGEIAVTHYRVERTMSSATYVRVQLETGRRNQIRVHFADHGHPVLGDERYRTDKAYHPGWRANRLALHAAILGFDHPRTKKALRFESPLPDDFQRFLTKQR
ncbi:MAG: RluA family pseudouridine synthase [Planctomycetota bacterium]